MIEILMTICLAAEPETCRPERLPVQDLPPLGCQLGAGAQVVSAWAADHPRWAVVRWSRGRPSKDA